MAPRASWKGFINLSLVSVSVKAYTASNSSGTIRMNQLHSECNSRIQQKIHCPLCGDISRDQLVKGYEYAKDQYVVIDLDELEKLRAKDEGKSVKIDAFVPPEQIDSVYHSDSNYYLVPDGPTGQKPFSLLHRVMTEKNLHCVANVVLHNKEQLVLIRPMENVLCMTVLKYASQVKSPAAFDDEVVESAISDSEIELAEALVDQTTVDEFDLEQYKDQYTERLTQLIEAKVNGEELVAAPTADTDNIINLMDALKASVSRAKEAKGGSKTSAKNSPAKKKTASKKKKPEPALVDQLANPKGAKRSKKKKKTG